MSNTFNLKFTMLGARRVGKTSLLAAMYDKLTDDDSIICITREQRTSAILSSKLQLLEDQAREASIKVDPSAGIDGSAERCDYKFELGKNGKDPHMKISFTDYPGGWLNASSGMRDEVVQIVKNSQVILVAIDSPALLEENGKFNEKINQPKEVCEVLKLGLRDNVNTLVLFCPVKAETYLKNERREDLTSAVKKSFHNSFEFLKSLKNTVVAIVPVQTMGCVYFNHIEVSSGKEPMFFFFKNAREKYEPKNCEQPLIYLLKFFLTQYVNREKSWFDIFVDFFFELDEDEKKAIEKLTTKLKRNDDGISIIHGNI
ncbi:MAG: hypothetical protein AB1403_04215 [Candidatus Riflebacteria bacterium]